jgi:hypothetical protein
MVLDLSLFPSFSVSASTKTGSPYVAQAGLQLAVLLPQPPKFWDYRHVPPCLAMLLSF